MQFTKFAALLQLPSNVRSEKLHENECSGVFRLREQTKRSERGEFESESEKRRSYFHFRSLLVFNYFECRPRCWCLRRWCRSFAKKRSLELDVFEVKKQMVEEMVGFEEKRLRKDSAKLGLSEGGRGKGRGRGEMKGACDVSEKKGSGPRGLNICVTH